MFSYDVGQEKARLAISYLKRYNTHKIARIEAVTLFFVIGSATRGSAEKV